MVTAQEVSWDCYCCKFSWMSNIFMVANCKKIQLLGNFYFAKSIYVSVRHLYCKWIYIGSYEESLEFSQLKHRFRMLFPWDVIEIIIKPLENKQNEWYPCLFHGKKLHLLPFTFWTGPSKKEFFKSFVSCIYFVCLWFLEK